MSAKNRCRRLHFSTYAVFLLPLAILAAVNCGGDYTINSQIEFGWPWRYGSAILLTTEDSAPVFIQSPGLFNLTTLNWQALAANIAVALLIAGTLAAVWEWRCRTRSWWKFTLRDGLAAVAVMAIVLAWFHSLYHDKRCTRRMEAAIDETKLRFYAFEDTPADWFWKMLKVPTDWRPSVVHHVDFTAVADEPQTLPPAAVEILGEYRSLKGATLGEVVLPPQHSEQLPWLKTLVVTNSHLRAKDFDYLRHAPNLTELILYNVTFSDDELRQLPGADRLHLLAVHVAPNMHGKGLESFKQLREIRLAHVDLDEQGLTTLLNLPDLQKLSLSFCELVPPEEWEAYRSCPVEKHAVEIDEAASAAAVARVKSRGLELDQERLDVRRYSKVAPQE